MIDPHAPDSPMSNPLTRDDLARMAVEATVWFEKEMRQAESLDRQDLNSNGAFNRALLFRGLAAILEAGAKP